MNGSAPGRRGDGKDRAAMSATGGTARTLKGQVALITGAGRGIGRRLAVGLAGEGVSVGLVGRDRGRLEETARGCAERGAAVTVAVADVRSAESIRDAVEHVRGALGPLNLLVNNAGLVDRGEVPFWEADPGHWWDVFETNFRGTVNACQAAVPDMVRRGQGRIVNINSIFAVRGDIRYSAYSASKAALLALSETLNGAFAQRGVHLFDISPGAVRTDMTLGMAICRNREEWTDPARIVTAVIRVARGELDPLAGQFLHVGVDDLDELLAAARGGSPPRASFSRAWRSPRSLPGR
ncbi:3-oxoacyl-ACP reductase [Planomonospora sphaerica]|uniref:3-oxoacyl-ACP reductase n=2 Tax=Planomonospora sphaerica TaxID=161355 RepID=A0A171DKC8_9ACTN|nr:3-oxoacyl-ACP reductase [Planomonospora sphaerica]